MNTLYAEYQQILQNEQNYIVNNGSFNLCEWDNIRAKKIEIEDRIIDFVLDSQKKVIQDGGRAKLKETLWARRNAIRLFYKMINTKEQV